MSGKRVRACSALVLVLLMMGVFSGCEKSEEVRIHSYDIGSPFITSVKDSKMHVQAEVTFEYNNEKDLEILDAKKYVVMDAINSVLMTVTEEQLKASDELIPQLGEKMAAKINESLGITSVTKVYFSKFVSQ